MASRYIELDSAAFEEFLSSKGFERSVQCNEVVYSRAHNSCKWLRVKVYTSITDGQAIARSVGSDAIRVCAAFNNGKRNFGVSKQPRVYRTGSQSLIQSRTYQRMRDAYQSCTDWLKQNNV